MYCTRSVVMTHHWSVGLGLGNIKRLVTGLVRSRLFSRVTLRIQPVLHTVKKQIQVNHAEEEGRRKAQVGRHARGKGNEARDGAFEGDWRRNSPRWYQYQFMSVLGFTGVMSACMKLMSRGLAYISTKNYFSVVISDLSWHILRCWHNHQRRNHAAQPWDESQAGRMFYTQSSVELCFQTQSKHVACTF